jgi:carbon storage regulator
MLKLRRHVGQSIHIGEHIKVLFLEQTNGSIILGIEAPKEIRILRSEIINRSYKQWNYANGDNAEAIQLKEL